VVRRDFQLLVEGKELAKQNISSSESGFKHSSPIVGGECFSG